MENNEEKIREERLERMQKAKEERIRQVKRQKMILGGVAVLFVLVLALSFSKCGGKKKDANDKKKPKTEAEQQEGTEVKKLPYVEVDLSDINSAYAVLAERETGKIIAEKGSEEKMYPASMTKIMTALTAIENIEDMDAKIDYPKELYVQLMEEHPSFAGFAADQKISVKDLLYGIVLPSGAESCKLLSALAGGTEDGFVEMMNAKAEEIGMKNTHFTNSSGFHDEDHYSTVADIQLLLKTALDNPTFYEIFTTDKYKPEAALNPELQEGDSFQSTMFEALDDLELPYEVSGGRLLGGKTGYTGEAGSCLASLAEIGGNEYILVTAKAERPNTKSHLHVKDAVNIYDQIGKYLENNDE